MENNDRPVNFDRLRLHICQIAPCRREKILKGEALVEYVEAKLFEDRFQRLLPTGRVFLEEIRAYFLSLVKMQEELLRVGSTDETIDAMAWNTCRVTETQVEMLLQAALKKCMTAYIEPGEAVGAIGAQSISEPGTQMTLKVRLLKAIHSYRRLLGTIPSNGLP